MKLKIAFSCDDVCPAIGHGLLLNNDPLMYLDKLNNEFGCKFTLFVVPIWNNEEKYNLKANVTWVNNMLGFGYYEFAAHGLTHSPVKKEYGGQEFLELTNHDIHKRIALSKQIFSDVGINVTGFKSPGWAQPKEIYNILEDLKFDYIGDHFIGTVPIKQNVWRIPYTFCIDKLYHTNFTDGDKIVLHSHISREFNTLNGWNKELYRSVRTFLLELQEKGFEIEFVYMKDLI